MAVTPKTRWMIIGAAFALTLAAVNWVNQTESIATAQASSTEVRPSPATQDTAKKADTIQLNKLKRAPFDAEAQADDPFKSKSWYVPPPPPKALPPPPPTAPPLPFTYLGKLDEEGVMTVFLTRQDRNYVIKAGDVIDGTYRVDTVTPSSITLTYLPLDIKQSMPLGDSN